MTDDPTTNQNPDLTKAVERWASAVAPRLLQALCPIYSETAHRPEPVGTGVLIRVADIVFLVSAAHVVDDVGRGPRYFGAGNRLLPLPPFVLRSPLAKGASRDDDPIDLGYWIVEPTVEAQLGVEDSLSLTDLDFESSIRIRRNADYFLNGYPATRQPRKVIKPEVEAHTLALLTTEVNDAEYVAANRNRDEHLLIGYAKDDFFSGGVKQSGPDLDGVSGGAIWRLSGTDNVNPGRPVLSAFATRWRKTDPTCVIGTRTITWVRQAAREFPEQFKRELATIEPH